VEAAVDDVLGWRVRLPFAIEPDGQLKVPESAEDAPDGLWWSAGDLGYLTGSETFVS